MKNAMKHAMKNNVRKVVSGVVGRSVSAIAILILGTTVSHSTFAQVGATAEAKMEAKSGSKAKGTVMFEETAAGLKVSYDLSGLAKSSKLGFHIHEKGDCGGKDAKAAGKHYKEIAPTGGTSTDNPQKYAGDLPEIDSDAQGVAKGSFEISQVSLKKDHPIEGLALIIHGGPDDVTKKSAPRIACGIIKSM